MNIIPGDDSCTFEREIHRGEIFYMTFGNSVENEQQGGRPCIVVSNETCNKFSPIVTVVPLTTKDKKPLPTHVLLEVEDLPVHGTILCEQVQSISHLRLSSYVGEVDDRIMRKIEKALAIQLDIDTKAQPEQQIVEKIIEKPVANERELEALNARIAQLESELDAHDAMLKEKEHELVKMQERARIFKELYDETIRGGLIDDRNCTFSCKVA